MQRRKECCVGPEERKGHELRASSATPLGGRRHVFALTDWTYRQLDALHHRNGQKLAVFYGMHDRHDFTVQVPARDARAIE